MSEPHREYEIGDKVVMPDGRTFVVRDKRDAAWSGPMADPCGGNTRNRTGCSCDPPWMVSETPETAPTRHEGKVRAVPGDSAVWPANESS